MVFLTDFFEINGIFTEYFGLYAIFGDFNDLSQSFTDFVYFNRISVEFILGITFLADFSYLVDYYQKLWLIIQLKDCPLIFSAQIRLSV